MQRLGDFEERLRALERQSERVRVLGNFALEFRRETLDERRRMLGDAAVALVPSDLSTAELARVERTLRLLDPEDLDTLAGLAELEGAFRKELTKAEIDAARRAGHPMGAPEYLYEQLMAGHLEGAALVAAGCVIVIPSGKVAYDHGVGLAARVTPIGRLVLRFMGRAGDEHPYR